VCIFEKHFIKIAHPVEKDGIRILILNGQVLLNHRGRFGRTHGIIEDLKAQLGSFVPIGMLEWWNNGFWGNGENESIFWALFNLLTPNWGI
jgi:hypothetical protein